MSDRRLHLIITFRLRITNGLDGESLTRDGAYAYGASSSFQYLDDDQSSTHSSYLSGDPTASSILDLQDGTDPDGLRPSLHRSGTTASVSLGTRKMKAVDLSAPPFTKEFIDQYRHRIKSDPDPEAHFKYAKYLIDAAKNIGANAPDQRAVRKYRELLVQEALKVVRRLATQGDPFAEAQFFLANCHGTGMLGLQVDHERAYHLYLQAAKQNHSAASYRVAVCNEIGAGTRREPPRAFAFYRKAASLGDTSAMYKLGMVLLSGGLGQPRNPREAVAWLRRAAEQADEDNPHSLHELGLLHENPDSQIVPYDPLYAKNLFTKAAQLGYTQSQYKLGQCYEYGSLTCSVDPRRSIGWYTRAAEKGDAEAELALSGWYLTGSDAVLKQSDSEAYLWARRAANKGLSKAEYAVGYYAEIGIGVKQDIELAKRWYMRAAAQGNKRAMNRLTELKRMGNRRGVAARPTRQQAKDECVVC
ncbi:HCP-like protein [Phellopilus nigrolimitatus]|nr:HCP-like protein [Phellopilus nigrolimitatus]